jgi:hypothetical protein
VYNYKLEKAWDWNEQAEIYYNNERPDRTDYPFWWYKVDGDDIYLIKQISKFCGVIQRENRYVLIDDRSTVEKLAKRNYVDDIDQETASELERRSWYTLGEVQDLEPTPREVVISHENGGGCIYRFHPVHGRMISCIWINADGETIYKSIFEYNDKHYAVKYGNTLGDRWAKVWEKEKNKYIWKKW